MIHNTYKACTKNYYNQRVQVNKIQGGRIDIAQERVQPCTTPRQGKRRLGRTVQSCRSTPERSLCPRSPGRETDPPHL